MTGGYGLPRHFVARNDMVNELRWKNRKRYTFQTKGHPFRSIRRGRAVAKIDHFLGWRNVYCTYNSARLEGSGEVALIAGAINSNPPQPASLVSFLPEQERYPPEEPHLQYPKGYRFRRKKLPKITVIARGRIATAGDARLAMTEVL